MHNFQRPSYILTPLALVTVIVACAGVAPAASTFQLQNVVNAAEASAAAGDLGGQSHDGPYYIVANPANASATASRGGYTGHGDAYAAYDASPYELSMVGTGNGSGGFGVDGGAVGGGHAFFNAEQNFGPDPVRVHIVGTFYLEHSPPTWNTGSVGFAIGSYSQSQPLYSQTLYGENGTLTFDDLVTLNGDLYIWTDLRALASGDETEAASYEVTLTIVPEPSTVMLLALAAITILPRGRRRKQTSPAERQ